MEMNHTYKWNDTKIGGFAQCIKCQIVDTEVKKMNCIGYVDPTIALKASKEKKKADLEKRKLATIAYLKNKGLPYTE